MSTWDDTYAAKAESERSWTQPVPADSLSVITEAGIPLDAPVIDIGGGASYLVDNLVALGHTDVTLLDISQEALRESRGRNGSAVDCVAADITQWQPPRTWTLWHDRAVFHFLTGNEQQEAYIRALLAGTTLGTHVVVATFAPDGPESCSGLPVQRWSATDLASRFGHAFDTVSASRSEHTTPWGSVQPFTFVHLVRTA